MQNGEIKFSGKLKAFVYIDDEDREFDLGDDDSDEDFDDDEDSDMPNDDSSQDKEDEKKKKEKSKKASKKKVIDSDGWEDDSDDSGTEVID